MDKTQTSRITDTANFAHLVMNCLIQDNVHQRFMEMFETGDTEGIKKVLEAYMDHACKKFQRFITKYKADPEAQEVFKIFVLNTIK